jgi:RNA polymerase sigma factor (sigma-70 family)
MSLTSDTGNDVRALDLNEIFDPPEEANVVNGTAPWLPLLKNFAETEYKAKPSDVSLLCVQVSLEALWSLANKGQLPIQYGRGDDLCNPLSFGWEAAKEAHTKYDSTKDKGRGVKAYMRTSAKDAIRKAAWADVTIVGTPSHKSAGEQAKKRLDNPLDLHTGKSLEEIFSSDDNDTGEDVFSEIPAGGPLEEAAETTEYRNYLLAPGKFKSNPPPKPRGLPVNIKPGEDRDYYRNLIDTRGPVERLSEREALAAVREWFTTLQPSEQNIMKMRLGLDFDADPTNEEREWTYEEIAEQLGCSKSKVERDIKKILKKGLLEMLAAGIYEPVTTQRGSGVMA